jgi:PAS domain S-box-containing protein
LILTTIFLLFPDRLEASAVSLEGTADLAGPLIAQAPMGQVLGGNAVVVAMLLVILALLVNIWRRMRVEHALRDSEKRWRALYENLPGYTFVVGPDYTIRDVNGELCELTGYRREELIGKPCDLICCMGMSSCPAHACETDFAEEVITPNPCNCSANGLADNDESTIRTKSGQLVPILRSVQRVPLDGQDIIIQNFQDLSARKEAEDVLRRSGQSERAFRESLWALFEVEVELMQQDSLEALCRRAVELGRDRLGFERLSIWFTADRPGRLKGAFGIDEHGQVRNLQQRTWQPKSDSPARQLLTGQGPRSLCRSCELYDHQGRAIGQGPWVGASMWSHQDLIGVVMTDTLHTGKPISQIDQNILTLLATSLGFLCQRLSSEAERARLAQAVEQAAEGIIITDARGLVLYVNQGLTRMLSRDDRCKPGLDVMDLFSDDSETCHRQALRDALAAGEVWSSQLTARNAEGKDLIVETTVSPIRDHRGRVSHFALILRDMSKEAQLEQQLRQSAKMEAVGRLAGGIAHDFNNQLTVIRGYTDLLLSEPDLQNDLQSGIEQISHAAQQATALTSQLLSFSRKQLLQPQVTDTKQLLTTMAKSLRLVGEDVRLDLDLRPETGNICVDPNRLEQAVMNLVINARDAMPDGGHVRIVTSNVTVSPEQATLAPVGEAGPHVMIAVSDTGTGMDAETLERIFEPFFTTKDKGKGTGLGLAMVYGFIQQSHGHIEVDSQPGQGTTFRLYLPRVETPIEEQDFDGPVTIVHRGQSAVLVVEDDGSVRTLIQRVLSEHGYRTLVASCPDEAHDLLQNHRGPLDLLVSDVVMPGCSGPNLLRQLRNQRPRLKCLLVSGYSEEAALHDHDGIDDVSFLHKPFTPDRLLRAVAETLQPAGRSAPQDEPGLFQRDHQPPGGKPPPASPDRPDSRESQRPQNSSRFRSM